MTCIVACYENTDSIMAARGIADQQRTCTLGVEEKKVLRNRDL